MKRIFLLTLTTFLAATPAFGQAERAFHRD